jgi:hypothetical protein
VEQIAEWFNLTFLRFSATIAVSLQPIQNILIEPDSHLLFRGRPFHGWPREKRVVERPDIGIVDILVRHSVNAGQVGLG